MSSNNVKGKVRTVFKIVGDVLMYLFFALCIFMLVVSVQAKKNGDDAATVFGTQMRVVVSESMEKCDQTDVSKYAIKDIPVKSMVFIDVVPEEEQAAYEWYSKLQKGDVLTFRYVYAGRQVTITHRIVGKTDVEGGFVFDLEGDNKASDANTLKQQIDTTKTDSPNYIIGRVTGQSYALGLALTAMESPVGIICIIIIPCLIIMGFEGYKLVYALTEKKRLAAKQREEERDNEVERLRKQLEELQRQNRASEDAQSESPAQEKDDIENDEEIQGGSE